MSRPIRRVLVRRLLPLLLLFALFAARLLLDDTPPPSAQLAAGPARIERVVDGDTLVVAGGARIRLQGVDAPETKHPDRPIEPFGPEAAAFTKLFISSGPVRLQFDVERKDRYGRWLAYVYAGDRLLNEELVRAGLARARLGYRYSDAMKARFRKAEQEARAARRGIWSNAAAWRSSTTRRRAALRQAQSFPAAAEEKARAKRPSSQPCFA